MSANFVVVQGADECNIFHSRLTLMHLILSTFSSFTNIFISFFLELQPLTTWP